MAVVDAKETLAMDAAKVVGKGVGILHGAAPPFVAVLGDADAEGSDGGELLQLGGDLAGGSHGERAMGCARGARRRAAHERGAAGVAEREGSAASGGAVVGGRDDGDLGERGAGVGQADGGGGGGGCGRGRGRGCRS